MWSCGRIGSYTARPWGRLRVRTRTDIGMSSDRLPTYATPENLSLLAQMRPALLTFFKRRCGSAAQAEDLTQDVLVRALAHSNWKSVEEAKGYVFRAAVNRWRDAKRREAVRGVSVDWDDAASFATYEEVTPDRVLETEQELASVVAALNSLSERTRDVFILVRLEHMKQADIAAMFGISVSAVEKHLAKALVHLATQAGLYER